MMKPLFADRLPKLNAILPVFAVISFLAYGRSLYIFVYKVPSWLTFLTVGEILSTLAYGLAWSLFESLFMLACLLAVALVLPAPWFRDIFVSRGTWFVLIALLSVFFFFRRYGALGSAALPSLPYWMLGGLLLALVASFLAGRIRFMSIAANWLADRLLVFLFLLIPASLISVFVVLIRNLI